MKKVLSLILTIAMVLSCVPLVFAEGEAEGGEPVALQMVYGFEEAFKVADSHVFTTDMAASYPQAGLRQPITRGLGRSVTMHPTVVHMTPLPNTRNCIVICPRAVLLRIRLTPQLSTVSLQKGMQTARLTPPMTARRIPL